MNIVLDTNVLVSALLNPDGPPAAILNLIVNARIRLLYDNRMLHDYLEVLHREKFGFHAEFVDAITSFFTAEGEFVTADPAKVEFGDADDRKFYEVMVSGEADFLVTGNRRHFPKNRRIINPADFLKLHLQI